MTSTNPRRFGASPALRIDRLTAAALAIGVVAVVGVRWWTSRGRRFYGIWPDEPAQLAMARFVGGGGARWNMNNHSTWRPGYATLVGVVHRFTNDPTTVFRSALAINAVLGGVSFLLLYVLARRLTSLSIPLASLVAVGVSLAPAIVFTTTFVWSEGLAQPMYLGAVVALLAFHERPTFGRGAAAGLLAAGAFAAHSRMLPLVIVVVSAAALATWRRRIDWRTGSAVAGVAVAGFVVVSWYSAWIVEQLWNEPSERNSYSAVAKQAGKLSNTLASVIGQSWYQLVTTAGLVGLGLVVLVAATGQRRGDGRPSRPDAALVLACVVSLALLSMVFMAGETRPDRIVYGRYNDAVFMPVTMLGVASLVSVPIGTLLRRLAGIAAVGTGLGFMLAALREDELAAGGVIKPMVLGLVPFVRQDREIDASSITLGFLVMTALVAIGAVLANVSARRSAVLVAIAAIGLVGYLRTDEVIGRGRYSTPSASSVAALDGSLLSDGDHVTYLLQSTSNDTGRMMAYQFFLPHVRFDIVDPDEFDPATSPTSVVVATPESPVLAQAGAAIAWQDPNGKLAFWVLRQPVGAE